MITETRDGTPGPCIHKGALVAFGTRPVLPLMKAYIGVQVVVFAVAGVVVVRVICLGVDKFSGVLQISCGNVDWGV